MTVSPESTIASISICLTIMRMVGSSPSNASSRNRYGVLHAIPQMTAAWRFIPFEKVLRRFFIGSPRVECSFCHSPSSKLL